MWAAGMDATTFFDERRFHGLRVRIAADSPALRSALLREFPHEDLPQPQGPERGMVEIRAEAEGAGEAFPEPPAPLQPGAVGLAYRVTRDRLWLETRTGSRGCFDLQLRTARLRMVSTADVEADTAALLGVGLPYLYRELGLYPVHASAVLANRTPVLLAGVSGSGKSTTAALLARSGFGFFADDLVLLEPTGDTLTLRGVPRPPRLDAAARRRLESLATGPAPASARSEPETFAARPPVLLLFPQVEHIRDTRLELLTGPEAVGALIRCSLLMGEKEATQKHLSALAALATEASAYRLRLGEGVEALPGQLRNLLAAASASESGRVI